MAGLGGCHSITPGAGSGRVGQIKREKEKQTQARIVALLRNRLDYAYPDNFANDAEIVPSRAKLNHKYESFSVQFIMLFEKLRFRQIPQQPQRPFLGRCQPAT